MNDRSKILLAILILFLPVGIYMFGSWLGLDLSLTRFRAATPNSQLVPVNSLKSTTWWVQRPTYIQYLTDLRTEIPTMRNAGFNSVWFVLPWHEFSPRALPTPVYSDATFNALKDTLAVLKQYGMSAMLPLNYTWPYPGLDPEGIFPSCNWIRDPDKYGAFEAYTTEFLTRISTYQNDVHILVFTEGTEFCEWSAGGHYLKTAGGIQDDFHFFADDNIYAIKLGTTGSKNLHRWDGSYWMPVGPNTFQIQEAIQGFSNNAIYAIGVDRNIWKWNGSAWAPHTNGGGVVDDFWVGPGEVEVYAIRSTSPGLKQLYYWNGSNWQIRGPSGVIQDSIDVFSGAIYSVGTDKNIYKWDGALWTPVTSGGEVSDDFWVVNENKIYAFRNSGCTDPNGQCLHEWNGGAWMQVYPADAKDKLHVARRDYVDRQTNQPRIAYDIYSINHQRNEIWGTSQNDNIYTHPVEHTALLRQTLGSLPTRLNPTLRNQFSIGYHDYSYINLGWGDVDGDGVEHHESPIQHPNPFDFVSMVAYGLDQASDPGIINELNARAQRFLTLYPSSPVVIGETGAYSCGYSEANQARVLGTIATHALAQNYGINIWGWAPYNGDACPPLENGLGLIRANGSEKPALATLRSIFPSPSPTPTPSQTPTPSNTTPPPPPICPATPPGNPSSTNITTTSATISWTPGTGGDFQMLRVATNLAEVMSGCPNNQCHVKVDSMPSTQSSYNITSMAPGTTYHWRVVNFNTAGACFRDIVSQFNTQQICPANPPTNLNTTQLMQTTAILNWTPGSGGNFQQLRVGTNLNEVLSGCPNNQCLVKIDNMSSSTNTYSVTNMTPGTTYYWRVVNFNTANSCFKDAHTSLITQQNQFTPGDIDRDGDVDIFDYNLLLARFGQSGNFPEDINGDGIVNIFDYNILVTNFGT